MRVAGRSVARLDGRTKVTGQLTYGMDLVMPGMLYGMIARSAYAHAHLQGIDVSAALEVPGVVAVITARDVPDRRFGGLIKDETVFAIDRVRFIGQPVAAVAAATVEAAAEAVNRLRVEYDPLPSLDDPDAALQDGAVFVHEDWKSYAAHPAVIREGNICGLASIVKGDFEGALSLADEVFEDQFVAVPVHQAYLEPRAALAVWDPSGLLSVYSNTQLPFEIQNELAGILGIPSGKIRVTSVGIGGGFGGKLRVGVEHIAAILAQRTRRPVKVALTMEEEFSAGYPRHGVRISLKTAVRRDGTIVARGADAVFDAGAFSGASTGIPSVATLVLAGPYRVPNLRIVAQSVYTHKQNFGSYRAPSGPQCAFACESQMDMIARRLRMDPLEFRLRNIVRDGDEGPTGQPLSRVSLEQALLSAAKAIGWGSPAGSDRGKGIACTWWTTTGGPSGVYLKVQPDGSVTLSTGIAENGTGALTGAAQILAEELGIDPDNITIVSADTFATPYDTGAQGSRSVFSLGNAIRAAAVAIRRQLGELAADRLEANPADLEFYDGQVTVKGVPTRQVAIAELARATAQRGSILAEANVVAPLTPYHRECVSGHIYPTFNSPSFHAHAAEVEVDRETGELHVRRYVVAQDVGFAVNPRLIKGQIHGGVLQGLGQALFEQISYDGSQPTVHNLTDYPLPRVTDAPPIDAILLESPSEAGPFGAKGVGEPPIILPPATIANALQDAVSVRITDLPITAEKVLRALWEQKET